MIRYVKSNKIDHEKWDKCINKSFNGNIYVLSWYLNFVHPNWDALIEDDYLRVMPLPLKSKYGIKYSMQPFFVQQLGVFSKSKLNAEKVQEFINAIPAQIKFIDLNFNIHNKIEGFDKQIIVNDNYMLDLVTDYDSISKKYSVNTRRNIKKASKNELHLLKNVKPSEIITLFKQNKGQEIETFTDADYKTLERLMYNSIHKGMGLLLGVYCSRNELCAAAFFVRFKQHLVFLFSGSNKVAKENRAMFYLIDEVIKQNSPSMLTLDFEGSNDPNLARFYKGFGAEKVNYSRLRYIKAGFPINIALKFMLKKL